MSADSSQDQVKSNRRKPGRPKKIIRGRPKRIPFPRLPKPAQFKCSKACSVNGCTTSCCYMLTLPEEDVMKECWLEFVCPPNGIADRDIRVCQEHFESQMWRKRTDGTGLYTLRTNAFPTLNRPQSKEKKHIDRGNGWKNGYKRWKGGNLKGFHDNIEGKEESQHQDPFYRDTKKSQGKEESPHHNPLYTDTKKSQEGKEESQHQDTFFTDIKKSQEGKEESQHQDPFYTDTKKSQVEEFTPDIHLIKLEPLNSMKKESIEAKLDVPPSTNMNKMENLKRERLEDELSVDNNIFEDMGSSNDFLSHNFERKCYRCPPCKYLGKASFNHVLKHVHRSSSIIQNHKEICESFPNCTIAPDKSNIPPATASISNGSLVMNKLCNPDKKTKLGKIVTNTLSEDKFYKKYIGKVKYSNRPSIKPTVVQKSLNPVLKPLPFCFISCDKLQKQPGMDLEVCYPSTEVDPLAKEEKSIKTEPA